MSPNEIKTYPLTGPGSEEILQHALKTLKPHLPVCLPLYRRLQFGRFFDASVLCTNVSPGSSPFTSVETKSDEGQPWLLAFIDRSCRPESEVWLHGSWESLSSIPTTAQPSIDALLTDLVRQTKALGVPTSIHQDAIDAAAEELEVERDQGGNSRIDYRGHIVDPSVMLWGAVHERTAWMMDGLGLLTRKFKSALTPNFTFIWEVDNLPPPKDLPAGLKWGELQRIHFPLVRRRTQIPRQDRTLAVLPNLAIFTEDGTPVSWAFVGLDASLTTLHVEQEWRGKGLAKAITTKLFEEKMNQFWEEGLKRLAHGYVIAGNAESEGMCRSLGGKSEWNAYWLRVDLGKV